MFPASRPEARQEPPAHIVVPAGQLRWRLGQLHRAGIHTRAIVTNGRASLGPLTPTEYAAAQAVLAQQTRTPDRVARWGMWLLIAGLGVSFAVVGPVILAPLLFLAIVAGVVALAMGAMGLESWTMKLRALLGRRHPDPGIRKFARRVWWMPTAGWLAMAAAALLLLGAIAVAMI